MPSTADRRRTGVALTLLIVVGLIAYNRIPLQLFPSEFSEPRLQVWIPNPGASARENEENVARPVEEQLRTLSGIDSTSSYSRADVVQISINFQAARNAADCSPLQQVWGWSWSIGSRKLA